MVKITENAAFLKAKKEGRLHFPIALSLAFYNSTRMLDLTLAGFSRQSFRDFEILICDDGSKPENVSHALASLNKLDIPARHFWHEDTGFRKNRIMNWGIHHCFSDYMVFIDQDCIPHQQFMQEHFAHRQKNSVLCGRRMDLTPWVSNLLTPEKVSKGFIEKNLWWIAPLGLYMKDNNAGKGLYFKSDFFRKLANQKPRGIVGCNFSVHRDELIKINGFDTRYEGAGTGEDTDIEFRMGLNGVQMLPFCNTAVQFHVYHRLLDRPSVNESIFAQVLADKKSVTDFGIVQQL
jgi:glycosyltransferase involved in cell wall biosynthesis